MWRSNIKEDEMIYECKVCGTECELYGESHEELSIWCEKCDEEIIDQFGSEPYEDYISDQSARAEYLYEGDR